MKLKINISDDEYHIIGDAEALRTIAQAMMEIAELGHGYSLTEPLTFDRGLCVECEEDH